MERTIKYIIYEGIEQVEQVEQQISLRFLYRELVEIPVLVVLPVLNTIKKEVEEDGKR